MAFRLKREEPLAKGVRRIAREQIDKALEELEGPDLETAIHVARKRFKRIRALLRLARPGLGRKLYDREDARFRDAGRPLSEVRDAGVLVTALDGLRERSGASAPGEAFEAARSALSARRDAVQRDVLSEGDALETVSRILRKARRGVERWKVGGRDAEVVEAGLRRIYRRGRKAYRAAYRDPSDENLHEWRKRTKDLRYACELLGSLAPGLAETEGGPAGKLADYLGDDHDLAVLAGVLAESCGPACDALLPLIEGRRAGLRRDSFALGRLVFAEAPKGLVALVSVQETHPNKLLAAPNAQP
jgi:CHAD domain-containing protein